MKYKNCQSGLKLLPRLTIPLFKADIPNPQLPIHQQHIKHLSIPSIFHDPAVVEDPEARAVFFFR